MRATYARIYLSNFRQNVRLIRQYTKNNPKICACVKANGYGHGLIPIAEAAIGAGASWLGVAICDEAVELREAGIRAAILLLGLPSPDEIETLIRNYISCVVADREVLELFQRKASEIGMTAQLHLNIDTGMARIGCRPDEAPALAETIHRSDVLQLEGVCTHFPVADLDRDFTAKQIRQFDRAVGAIRDAGIDPGVVHAANSSGIVDFPEAWYDMVRAGILLYGYYATPRGDRPVPVRPVMELVSSVSFIKRVPANTGISYGLSYKTTGETTVATVAAGYGDGYSRLLSNRADVSIRERRYRVSGNICMDQFMVDLGNDSRVRRYDEVILFGPGETSPDAEELSSLTGTIPYEITCSVSQRVPREYVEGPRRRPGPDAREVSPNAGG